MLFNFKDYLRFMKVLYCKGNQNKKRLIHSSLFSSILTTHIIIINISLFLDNIFFPNYKNKVIKSPIFIFGNPRSGTTFLHRLMSEDKNKFIFFKTWEMLIPSLIMRYFVSFIGEIDKYSGNILANFFENLENRVYGNFRHIHHIALTEPEEDEGLFIFLFYSSYFYLVVPCIKELSNIAIFDKFPYNLRRKLLDFYDGCLKRHYYFHNENDKIFLSKNPSFSGKFLSIYEKYPDAKFIYLIRHPYEAIPSILSFSYFIWSKYDPKLPKDDPDVKIIAKMMIELYKYADENLSKLPKESLIRVNYHELIANPKEVVERVYKYFNMEISKEFEELLIEETEKNKGRKSRHEYTLEEFGITKEEVYNEMKEIFEKYGFSK